MAYALKWAFHSRSFGPAQKASLAVLPLPITVFASSLNATHSPLYSSYIFVQSIAILLLYHKNVFLAMSIFTISLEPTLSKMREKWKIHSFLSSVKQTNNENGKVKTSLRQLACTILSGIMKLQDNKNQSTDDPFSNFLTNSTKRFFTSPCA